MIYFVAEIKAIKIGFSEDEKTLEARLNALKTSNSGHLVLLNTAEGDFISEQKIQQRFYKDNIRGEWFYPSEELIKLIGLNKFKEEHVVFKADNDSRIKKIQEIIIKYINTHLDIQRTTNNEFKVLYSEIRNEIDLPNFEFNYVLNLMNLKHKKGKFFNKVRNIILVKPDILDSWKNSLQNI